MKNPDEVRIGNIYLDYSRESALRMLAKVKEMEKKQIAEGKRYVRTDDKTLKLMKVDGK